MTMIDTEYGWIPKTLIKAVSELARQYAKAGAKFLDDINPGWATNINVESLDLSVGSWDYEYLKGTGKRVTTMGCVLCQVYQSDYEQAQHEIEQGIEADELISHEEFLSDTLGFETSRDLIGEADELVGVWKDDHDANGNHHTINGHYLAGDTLAYAWLTVAWLDEVETRVKVDA